MVKNKPPLVQWPHFAAAFAPQPPPPPPLHLLVLLPAAPNSHMHGMGDDGGRGEVGGVGGDGGVEGHSLSHQMATLPSPPPHLPLSPLASPHIMPSIIQHRPRPHPTRGHHRPTPLISIRQPPPP